MNHLPPIAIYCSSASYGGLEMNTSRLAQWLTLRGHQVNLCILPDTPLEKHAKNQQIPVLPIKKNRRYGAVFLARSFAKTLKSRQTGILIFVDNRDLDFAMWTRLFLGRQVKMIYQQHMMLGIPRKDLVHTFRYRSLDAWITLLPYMAREIREKTHYPEERIHLIPLGTDVDLLLNQKTDPEIAREQLNLPQHGVIIGILGRLDPQKGQHVVIDAFAKLQNQGYTQIHLLIMGETTRGEHDHYLQDLQQMIHQNALKKQVTITDYQDNIGLFFSAIDLFVLGSYGETYGMVTIESMLFGVPVIGSDAGGTPEILNHGTYGWLYPPRDAEKLSRIMAAILDDLPEAKKRAVRAQTYARTAFSHVKECKQLEILLTNLVKDKDEKQTV